MTGQIRDRVRHKSHVSSFCFLANHSLTWRWYHQLVKAVGNCCRSTLMWSWYRIRLRVHLQSFLVTGVTGNWAELRGACSAGVSSLSLGWVDRGCWKAEQPSWLLHGGILPASTEALITSPSWECIPQKSGPHNISPSVVVRVADYGDRGLCRARWSCFVPQDIVPWRDAEAALTTLLRSRRIPALPQHRSIWTLPLFVVYLAR